MNKSEKFATLYPEARVIENPAYATIFVRHQEESSLIDRVTVLPEMPADHPIMITMERYGFKPVARIYAEQVASFIYKGFYKPKKAEDGSVTIEGTYCSTVLGERIENEDGEAFFLNAFMFKGFHEGLKRDSKGNVVKDVTSGHPVMTRVGYVRDISFWPFDHKSMTEKMLGYKTCALPLSIKVKGLKKIEILASSKSRMFTVSGEAVMKSFKAEYPAMDNKPAPASAPAPTATAEVVDSIENSGADDLPF